MRLIRGLHNLRDRDRGCVATIGNFDGVHLGHRAVFARLKERGQALGLPATVITFEPQPMEYFIPDAAPARLTRLREKIAAIACTGIERIMLLKFGARLAGMDARGFADRLLVQGLGVRFLLVGDDFRFGHQRSGDFQLLSRIGVEQNFAVENLHTVKQSDERISSTRIREAIARGDLEQARRLLGRPYSIPGPRRTRRQARAYHRLPDRKYPFASARESSDRCACRACAWSWRTTAAGGGKRRQPADPGGTEPRLEVHLFDFEREIYGAHLEVEFQLKLREEQRFESFDALKQQIARDAAAAKQYLADRMRTSQQ